MKNDNITPAEQLPGDSRGVPLPTRIGAGWGPGALARRRSVRLVGYLVLAVGSARIAWSSRIAKDPNFAYSSSFFEILHTRVHCSDS